ncbi:MAG: hypothetical protein RIS17_1306, partial [Pseudomonadota bacterium]
PLMPRRWPWMVAILAGLLWAGAVIVMAVGAPLPPALARALPAIIGLMAPVAVVWLAMLHLRDAGAVAAARAAIADARTQQAAEWLEHSAASLARLEEQLAATTSRLASMETPVVDHARAVKDAAHAIEGANVRLAETVAQAVAAGSNVAGVVPAATSQAETLIELLGRAENTLRAQMAETETLLAGLYTRASEAEAEARRAGQASRGEINALAEASANGLNAMASAAASARDAVQAPIGELNAAIDDAFRRTTQSVEQTRDAVHAQTSALLASVDQARTALTHIGGETAKSLDERLATLQQMATNVAGEIEASGRSATAMVEELGSRIEALESRLSSAIAANSDALAGLDERLAAASNSIAAFAVPFDSADQALAAVQKRLEDMGSEAARTVALFEGQLPAGEQQLAAVRAQLAGLESQVASIKDQAATLAEPLETGTNTLNLAGDRLAMARETLAATASDLADAIARAQAQMQALEADTSRLSLTASGDLIETFGRVREVADAAAGAMRNALAGVIVEAEDALNQAAVARTEEAFAAPIRARIEELVAAQAKAGESAQAASERVVQRLLALNQTLAEVESHVDRVETRAEVRARNALGRRANALIDSLQSSAIDLAKLLDYDIDDKTWADYAAGDASAIARRLALGLDSGAGRQFARHYAHDAEFRTEASRYLQEFETLVADVVPERGGDALGATLLSSTLGKLYLAIGQAAGRFN